MPLAKYKGYYIRLAYSEKYRMWSWDVNVDGKLGAGPADTREQAEADARAYIDAYTAPGGPRLDMFGGPAKPNLSTSSLQGFFDLPDVGKMTAERDVLGLIKTLGYKKDPDMRRAAAKALGEIGDSRAAEPLSVALNDEDKGVREAAAEALAELSAGQVGESAIPPQAERALARDNKGTRYKTESQARSFWTAFQSKVYIPIIIYRFNTLDVASEAIKRLSYIHEASDTGDLISSEIVDFGCYLNDEGQGEIFIAGRMFTHDMWREAKEKLEAAGGIVYYEQEPERITKKTVAISSVTSASSVKFVREDRQGMYTYRVHHGPSKAAAIAFLQENPVKRQLYYIVVETPEGTFCRDIQGIYKE
jgi:hypothetical protein